jgi:nonsense-mediated mRNA decay protein 3
VINIENTDFNTNVSRAASKQKFKMVQVEVARAADFGVNDKTFIVNTHLGEFLNFNDSILCYDLEAMTINELDELDNSNRLVPPVVPVRKTFPKFRKRQKHRIWKLKELDKEHIDENNYHKKNNPAKNKDKDKEMFLRDIEEDVELRHQIDLYRVSIVIIDLYRTMM